MDNRGGALPLSGGALTGSRIERNIDTNYLLLCGGNWRNGAFLQVYGKNYTTAANKGQFQLTALDGSSESTLLGRPDGSLTWNSGDLAGSTIISAYLGTHGYIKYKSGLLIQYGAVSLAANVTSKSVAFSLSFKDKWGYIAAPSSLTTGNRAVTWTRGTDGSSMTLTTTAINSETTLTWIAIGYN